MRSLLHIIAIVIVFQTAAAAEPATPQLKARPWLQPKAADPTTSQVTVRSVERATDSQLLRPSAAPLAAPPQASAPASLTVESMRAKALAAVENTPAAPASWSATLTGGQLYYENGPVQVVGMLNGTQSVTGRYGGQALWDTVPAKAISVEMTGLTPGSAYVFGCALQFTSALENVRFGVGDQTTTVPYHSDKNGVFADSVAFVAPSSGSVLLNVTPQSKVGVQVWWLNTCTVGTAK